MNVFENASEHEIKKLILSSLSKSRDLDPTPTSVLSKCLGILLTPITDIINTEWTLVHFLEILKKFM